MNRGSSMLELLSFFFFSLLESDAGGAGLSPPAAWAAVSRGTAVSATTNIASVKSLAANLLICRSRFPSGTPTPDLVYLHSRRIGKFPGDDLYLRRRRATMARHAGGNMTNMSSR